MHSAIVVLERDLSFVRKIDVNNCRYAEFRHVDSNTLIVACAGNTQQSRMLRVSVHGGSVQSSYALTEHYRQHWLHLPNHYQSSARLRGERRIEIPTVGYFLWRPTSNSYVGYTSGFHGEFGHENYTEMFPTAAFSPPDEALYDKEERLIYVVSERHRVVAWDVRSMRVKERDPVCGTTSLELTNMQISGLVVDSRKGYMYAVNAVPPYEILSVRSEKIEFESANSFRVSHRTGYLHNVYPLIAERSERSVGENSASIHNLNRRSSHNRHDPRACRKVGPVTYFHVKPTGPSPHDAHRKCKRLCVGKSWRFEMRSVQPGYRGQIGQRRCLVCPEGQFSSENASSICALVAVGLRMNGWTRIMLFRKVRKSTGAVRCEMCPPDHYHLIRGSTKPRTVRY